MLHCSLACILPAAALRTAPSTGYRPPTRSRRDNALLTWKAACSAAADTATSKAPVPAAVAMFCGFMFVELYEYKARRGVGMSCGMRWKYRRCR